MRGGAIIFFIWGTVNLVLLAIGWIWSNKSTGIHVGMSGFAVLSIYVWGALLVLMRREALRKGAPEYRGDPQPLPRISLSAAGVGLSAGLIAFGIVFGQFLVYIGAGLLLLSFGRMVQELRWQRATMRALREREP
jgi:hypothetical protein